MSIGSGIAIAGIWLFVAVAYQSKNVSHEGSILALLTGIAMTVVIVLTSLVSAA